MTTVTVRSTRTAIAGDTSTDVLASSRRGELVAAEAGDTVMDKVAEVLGVQLSATSAELQRVADSLETEVSTSLSSCVPVDALTLRAADTSHADPTMMCGVVQHSRDGRLDQPAGDARAHQTASGTASNSSSRLRTDRGEEGRAS